MNSFVAIDFETAQPARHSACAIGIVKVKEGVIIQRFFSLIIPPDNDHSIYNTNVNGISSVHTEHAPPFIEVYPIIKLLIDGQHIVCHNAEFDIDVLIKTMSYNGINKDDVSFDFSCTCKLFDGRKLNDCCDEHNITLNHHDVMSDAEACARLFMIANSATFIEYKPGNKSKPGNWMNDRQKICGDVKQPDLDAVENKENPFFGKKVVISGVYRHWPDRNDLATILKNLGADIDGAVSMKTDYLIAGDGVGPSKLKKMQDLISFRKDARILNEDEIIELLSINQ